MSRPSATTRDGRSFVRAGANPGRVSRGSIVRADVSALLHQCPTAMYYEQRSFGCPFAPEFSIDSVARQLIFFALRSGGLLHP